ncbi:hypothetical protein BG011_004097 [Mortierella polycephala]|uniref:Uncharacterized protein n=1 Tax=Mortierella polycephala TaxID=41804 RepID=A0A9P6U347_9FUNG|nr:hypothetical protein BG011_004097 [Mortierella polycephala]
MALSLLIANTVHAAPMCAPNPATTSVSLEQLTTAFAGNCPQETVGEVITCKDALPFINAAIKKYGLKTRGQRAAYIANMAYEGAYLKYNHNLVNHSQGTRSIMPAVSLRRFVDANKSVQTFWPGFPNNVDDNTIVDVLINHHADFEPGAWWTVAGPGCAKVASSLGGSQESFVAWETACINGGADTIPQRAAIYNTVYAAIQ